MRMAWLGLAAAGAVVTVASCGPLGLVGVAALAAWSSDTLFSSEPSRFRVGGTITGLSGSVTLQLNETEFLTRSEDGPFAFESPFENRSKFSVQVIEFPPEQVCSLQSASGFVSKVSVNSVQVNCALRTYSIGGKVEGLTGELGLRINGNELLSITNKDSFTFQTELPKGHDYEVSVVVQPRGLQCELLSGARGTIAGPVSSIAVQCRPFLTLGTRQSADLVYKGTESPATLRSPWGNPVFAGERLYVSDRIAHRILVFEGLPTRSDTPAAFVLGQPNFQSTGSRGGVDGLSSPESLSSDGARLAVADKGNHRVLVYSRLPSSWNERPALVLGQPDFDAPASGACDAFSLGAPEGVFIGHGKLIVADTRHNRVLIWDEIDSLYNGKPADRVLGQQSLEKCAANGREASGGAALPSDSSLRLPGGVWTDGTRLLVADTGNNRVLLWNTFPTRNGQRADTVLGAADFISDNPGKTQDRMFTPRTVTSTGKQVFVVDHGNNRVLVWDRFPTVSGDPGSVSGTPPNTVLGQPNFTSRTPPNPPTDQSLHGPSGVLVAVPLLIVTDSLNNRLVMFKSN